MWTPTDHWLEITIETLGRWEGWMAQGALRGENIYGKYLRLEPLQRLLSPLFLTKIYILISFFNDERYGGGGGGAREG